MNLSKEQYFFYEWLIIEKHVDQETLSNIKIELDKAQIEYENLKGHLEGLNTLLEMVQEDFKKYGWNPAG